MMNLRELTLNVRMRHPDFSLDKCRLVAGKMLTDENERRLNGRPAFWKKGHKPETMNTPDTTTPNGP